MLGRPSTAMAVLSVALLAGAGCRERAVTGETSVAAPVSVVVERARAVSEAQSVAVPGQVKPVHETVLSSRIQGAISRIAARAGDRVEEGDLLAELVSGELSARVRRAGVELEAATLALNRVGSLIESSAATAQELEVAEARHRAARAALDEAEIFENYAVIRAPFAGVVVRRRAEPGDLVSPGQPVLELQSAAGFRLEAGIPESLAGSIAVGDAIAFTFDHPEISGEAAVAEIEPAAGPATRTVLVKADLPGNPSVRAGQFGRLFVPGGEVRRITVSEASLVRRGQLEYLFVVSENRAHIRLVRTGRSFGGEMEILAGLDGGETVTVDPPDGLRDGAAVEMGRDGGE